MKNQKVMMLVVGIILVLNTILVWLGAWEESTLLTWLLLIVGIVLIIFSQMNKDNKEPMPVDETPKMETPSETAENNMIENMMDKE